MNPLCQGGSLRSIGSLASSSKESTDQPVKTVCTNLEETEGPPDQELSDTGVVNVGYLELTALDAAARGSRWSLSRAKRALDIALSLPILIIAAVPMVVIGLCARLSSRGPAIFVQQRVGRYGRLFSIYKFRSMIVESEAPGPGLTKCGDPRVTPLGKWLRKFKLDELPQLYNVLRGDLSLVGPRPKLPQYEVDFNMPYRPGITGASTLVFRNEEQMLSRVSPKEMEAYYEKHIKPLKARLDSRYMRNSTSLTDLRIIVATLLGCLIPNKVRSAAPRTPPQRMDSHRSSSVLCTTPESLETNG
jgi:lipopolysaccharide/colanic/teichoic acid biosynthesis glycosyltransferase